MDLINVKVKHRTLGDGVVVAVSGNIVEVEFSVGIKKLKFPDTFEDGMTAVDADIQKKIIDKAKKDKEAERIAREAERIAKEAERADRALETEKAERRAGIRTRLPADYHPEHLSLDIVLTYQEVESRHDIIRWPIGRGINPKETEIVLISSIDEANDSFTYHDRWTADGDYIYSGEGSDGDQSLTNGNLAIVKAAADGKKIRLYVKFSPREYYYQGVFELVDYTYEDEKDREGNIRKEYKFRLRKVSDD